MTHIFRIILLITLSCILVTDSYSCSCRRAWRNSFLSNAGRFDIIAIGTIGRKESDSWFGSPYLAIKKLYKGQVKDSLINLIDGGLDCRHIWISDSGVQVVVGLFKQNSQGEELYSGAGCITSVLQLNENGKLISDPLKTNYYSGQARKSSISWISKNMKLRSFERRIRFKTLFNKPKIEE